MRRANEALDWIEARQGPLPPTNYARIETDVRTVRAMGEQADDARISEIRSRHRGERISTEASAPEYCPQCIVRWPCDYGRLLARLDALTVEIERERYHVGNLNICIKNFTAKCDQLQRQVETATRSVDDWREAWEQKQIELEQSEAERDALRARAERAELALAGMLESYELCMGSELAFSALTKDILRGVFINEPERARAALAAAGEGE